MELLNYLLLIVPLFQTCVLSMELLLAFLLWMKWVSNIWSRLVWNFLASLPSICTGYLSNYLMCPRACLCTLEVFHVYTCGNPMYVLYTYVCIVSFSLGRTRWSTDKVYWRVFESSWTLSRFQCFISRSYLFTCFRTWLIYCGTICKWSKTPTRSNFCIWFQGRFQAMFIKQGMFFTSLLLPGSVVHDWASEARPS